VGTSGVTANFIFSDSQLHFNMNVPVASLEGQGVEHFSLCYDFGGDGDFSTSVGEITVYAPESVTALSPVQLFTNRAMKLTVHGTLLTNADRIVIVENVNSVLPVMSAADAAAGAGVAIGQGKQQPTRAINVPGATSVCDQLSLHALSDPSVQSSVCRYPRRPRDSAPSSG